MGLLDRLRGGLRRTREVLTTPVEDLVRGRRPLDAKALEAVEEALIAADLGLPAVAEAMEVLRARSGEIAAGGLPAMREVLRDEIRRALERPGRASALLGPAVGRLRGGGQRRGQDDDHRQAGRRRGARRAARCSSAPPTPSARRRPSSSRSGPRARGRPSTAGPRAPIRRAVLTDALRSARSRGADAVLVDTAGRLHTKANLMAELAKMARVAAREVPGAPHETLLVLDATDGQQRPRPGARVREGGRGHRPRAHQARRHRQGRRRGGGGARAGRPDPLRGGGRERSTTSCRSTRPPSPTSLVGE